MIALIDNDFVQKLAEIKRDSVDEKTSLIKRVFDAKNLDVHMHCMVFDHEFINHRNAKAFFDKAIISILRWERMFDGDEAKKAYYCFIVPELYKKMNGVELEFISEEVLINWISGSSLGEVHSLAACYVCGYGLFLSDDSDSKYLRDIIAVHFQKRIPVYNRQELIEQLEGGILKRDERRAFAHKK